jgi:transcriptional regulator with XRE-family HTH domain
MAKSGHKPDRRRQVLGLHAKGLLQREIAARLGVSRSRVSQILCAAGVRVVVNQAGVAPTDLAVRCQGCGAEVGRLPGASLRGARGALCRACLAARPEAGLGERLRADRIARGLSVRELARRVGMPASLISLYESGARVPSARTLRRLAKALLGNADVGTG